MEDESQDQSPIGNTSQCAEVLEEVRLRKPVKVLTEEIVKIVRFIDFGNHGAVFEVELDGARYALKVVNIIRHIIEIYVYIYGIANSG